MTPEDVTFPTWLSVPERSWLDETDLRRLDVLFARILPEDAARGIPGAVRVRASRFVGLLLARGEDVYREIPAWRRLYAAVLSDLEAHVRTRWQAPLEAQPAEHVDELLRELEAGTFSGLRAGLDPKVVFTTLRRHCIQGCFSDPRWGGNDGSSMWRAVGYINPPEPVL
jgi:gluconate 2-dehydrogenase gamma chain